MVRISFQLSSPGIGESLCPSPKHTTVGWSVQDPGRKPISEIMKRLLKHKKLWKRTIIRESVWWNNPPHKHFYYGRLIDTQFAIETSSSETCFFAPWITKGDKREYFYQIGPDLIHFLIISECTVHLFCASLNATHLIWLVIKHCNANSVYAFDWVIQSLLDSGVWLECPLDT